jgi:hypothetical protein
MLNSIRALRALVGGWQLEPVADTQNAMRHARRDSGVRNGECGAPACSFNTTASL